jgi:SAM-dependent methyltransferase
MTHSTEKRTALQAFSSTMKRDWDERARQNAKWFINTIKLEQSDEEFDAGGSSEVERFIVPYLPRLTRGRDPQTLRLLELGCGLGRMTRRLAELFGEVCATDVSGEMITQARARLQSLPNVRLFETDGLGCAALPDDYFDLAFSVYVFQHMPSAEVIRANIADVYRALKPGGVFKFQTNSVTSPDYLAAAKDTWAGATFPEAEIRQLARELGAHLSSIHDPGTQYCWTVLHKRPRATIPRSASAPVPRIEFFSRSDDPRIKAIPASGDYAFLTLILSGLPRAEVDANNPTVEINGQEVWPCYAGELGPEFIAVLQPAWGARLGELAQINLPIPGDQRQGWVSVRVQFHGGGVSAPVTVELLEPQLAAPQIRLVRNNGDGGIDICTRGPKSDVVIYVDGLDDAASVENVRVQIGRQRVQPRYVGFVPGNGVYEVYAQLPADLAPGKAELQLHFRDLVSPVKQLQLKDPEAPGPA